MMPRVRWSVVVAVALGLLLSLSVVRARGAESGPLSIHLVEPCRFFDTRDQEWFWYEYLFGPLDSRYYLWRVQGTCGVPVGAEGLLVNVTATEATAEGHLALFDGARPLASGEQLAPRTSNLNFGPGRTVANSAVVRITPSAGEEAADLGLLVLIPSGDGGTRGTVHVVLDVVGYLR